MVTGCGIAPGEAFTYAINTGEQKGTFWLHSHIYGQYVDDLRTPFIIHEKEPKYEEIPLYFEDWGQTDFRTRAAQNKQTKLSEIPAFYPTALINDINGNLTQPIQFNPGTTYRIRVVCMSSSLWFKFTISGHKLQIIEGDGVSALPLEVDGLGLDPGQRISALATAFGSDEFNYLYNVTMYPGFSSNTTLPRYYSGLVNYRDKAPIKHILQAKSDDSLVWSDFIDMQQETQEPLLPVDRQLVWTVRGHATKYDTPYYSFGNYVYNTTLVPSLFTALTMGDLAFNSSICGPQSLTHVLRYGEHIEIQINNPDSRDHNLHMHMHNYQIVEVGPFGNKGPLEFGLKPIYYKHAGQWPMRGDSATIRTFSYIKIRFRVDRGFVALAHCHIETHMDYGMAVTLVAAPDLLQKHVKTPQSVLQMCRLQNIRTAGNAAGNQGFDLTGLPSPVATKLN
ncbi:ferroxidase fet3 [Coemansia brasiliensis]|uniref:Ferroxidase fet3 n=1 Tax=Coemansia brasiliensis TaxID=2650707 RepID=A0A9W8I7X9_9FUNG|nr:ferroxidase fet3 [Coemansia brasiliensis]